MVRATVAPLLLALVLAAAPARAEPAGPEQTLDELGAALRGDGLEGVAAAIDARVKQASPKYKLSPVEARAVAGYLVADLKTLPRARALAGVLPRATVELVRAVHERDVPRDEAEAIADYLVRLTDSMRFGNLKALDVSQMHVIGREWHQIDYSGEKLTWQSQKAAWEPLGVVNFKKAQYVRIYFEIVSKMAFFKRVYQPAGTLPR